MKKIVCRVISVIMCAICVCTIVLCVKVINEPVRGFLDFRDIAFVIFGGAGIMAAIIAYITGKIGWKSENSKE